MPGRFGVAGGGVVGRRGLAVGAGGGQERHDVLDALGRESMAMMCPECPGCPPGWRPVGALTTGLGVPGGSSAGGEEECEELRPTGPRRSRSSACTWAICGWASCTWPKAPSTAARSVPHSGPGVTGVEITSPLKDDPNERNAPCKSLEPQRFPLNLSCERKTICNMLFGNWLWQQTRSSYCTLTMLLVL